MKAKPIVCRGIHFRSKTEARWYIFMKKLGWNVEYEPEIPGLYGWLPDFIILGPKGSKVLVEVKPFKNNFDFESNYGIETLNKIKNTKYINCKCGKRIKEDKFKRHQIYCNYDLSENWYYKEFGDL